MRNDRIFTRFQKVLKSISIFMLLAIPLSGFAQYDYEHYVPPFYNGSSSTQDIGIHKAILSTNSDAITVEVYQGKKFIKTISVTNDTPGEFLFKTPNGNNSGTISKPYTPPTSYDFPYNVIGVNELNKKLTDQGYRFYSNDAPFFVNIRHSTYAQGGSLTTKGTYAYGTEFYTGHVYTDRNNSTHRRSHFISVMATEDNTDITFGNINCRYYTILEGDQVKLRPISSDETISVNLDKGESYVIAVDHDFWEFYNLNWFERNGMNGTSVNSTKPIVVNTGSWTSGPRDGQDMGIDQIVPIERLGKKYVLMKGQGNNTTERPIVVATDDNTEVRVNDILVATLDKGDYHVINDPYKNGIYAYVTSNKDIYVYQTLSGSRSTIGPTVGMNFIPPLSTSGIREVTVPKAHLLADDTRNVNGVITILTQHNAVVRYSRNGGQAVTLDHSKAIPIGTSKEWEMYKFNENLNGHYRFFANKAINVAWIVESDWVGAAGYYSGFTKAISKIIPDLDVDVETDLGVLCESFDEEKITITAQGSADFFEWYVNDINSKPFSNTRSIVVDVPDEETSYYVVGSYRDPSLDQLTNGDFSEEPISNYIYAGKGDYAQLNNPGEYCRVFETTQANPKFQSPKFNDLHNDYMFMAISKNAGDTILETIPIDVVEGYTYILRVYGRSVYNVSDPKYNNPQTLEVFVNDQLVEDNFTMNDPNAWQSVTSVWRPKSTDEIGVIKLVNKNPSGVQSTFAIDSISFGPSVDATAVFVAKVIPNYSYSNNGKTYQFCQGTEKNIDVSNGDTSWYNYSWSKKDAAGNYIDIEDVSGELAGTKTHELIFLNPQQDDEGDYRCQISFKEEYKDCATSTDDVHVDLSVLVDEPATVRIDADKTNF
ncbi:IgGFc-binding protein, partial [Marinifilum sp. D737]|uniref:IgGFc-binding protein n=1 Tax=Marinifilum sp. D737 TaxID=2969628 RepID=UPI0022755240